jgi:hypothetical protein
MNEGRYGGPQESTAYRMVCRGTNHWIKAERNDSDRRKIEVFGEGRLVVSLLDGTEGECLIE